MQEINEGLPKLTNSTLNKYKQRSYDSGLLIDLVPVHNSFSDENKIFEKINSQNVNRNMSWFELNLLASTLSKSGNIESLSTLELLEGRLEPYPYQLKVAINVLKEKSSVALLADEVGLGKTIEVGLVMKEHIVRENIHSILIITPKALVLQWKDELKEKFDEDFVTTEDDDFEYGGSRVIVSFTKLSRNVEKFSDRQWDMIIVDEAHLLINSSSKRRQAISSLDRRYMLLSTATPLCNKLTDIYSLVDLLYPGILGTEKSFRSRFFGDRYGRVCKPEMKEELKKTVSMVMVRTLRAESGIPFTERHVYSLRINGSREETLLYEAVLKYMKFMYDKSSNVPLNTFSNSDNLVDKFLSFDKARSANDSSTTSRSKISFILLKELITMQQSLSSSPNALIKSLERRLEKYPEEIEIIEELIEMAKDIGTYSKTQNLLETLNNIPNEQGIVFTLRLETAYMLCDHLNENFMSARVYEGKMSGSERQSLIDEFRKGKVRYIVATDTAAEGLNLQNASIVVNFDLHWNPMKIEQRIGRVHRRGQSKDVNIFNLVMKDSIDDYVLKVLYEKIDLFKMTIGGIETILSEIKDDDASIEETIIEIILRSSKRRDIERELDDLRKNMEYVKEQGMLREEFSRGILD